MAVDQTPSTVAGSILALVNNVNSGPAREAAELLTRQHPTLVQNTGRMFLHFFLHLAEAGDDSDPRCEAVVKLARAISDDLPAVLHSLPHL